MKCWAIYCYGENSNCADCLAGIYFNKEFALESYGNGEWTYGKEELKEFEIAPDWLLKNWDKR